MTTLGALAADLKSFSGRSSLTDGQIASFVRLAEANINHDLRVAEMRHTEILTISGSEGVEYPDHWLDTISVMPVGDDGELAGDPYAHETWNSFQEGVLDAGSDTEAWAENGDTLHVRPTPSEDTRFSVTYYRNLPTLVPSDPPNLAMDSAQTNKLLKRSYDVYFNACMLQLALWMEDSENESKYDRLYGISTGKVKRAEKLRQVPTTVVHNKLVASSQSLSSGDFRIGG